jgi:hypothetical protein
MKIKSDFVTNSSSSSFLVVFDKLPETVNEMKEVLFGSAQVFKNPYQEFHEIKEWDAEMVSAIVLEETSLAKDSEILEFFAGYADDDFYDICKKDNGQLDWKKYEDMISEKAKNMLNEFKQKYEGKHVSIYNYSDNNGELGCAMEHGGLFGNLVHFVDSQH